MKDFGIILMALAGYGTATTFVVFGLAGVPLSVRRMIIGPASRYKEATELFIGSVFFLLIGFIAAFATNALVAL